MAEHVYRPQHSHLIPPASGGPAGGSPGGGSAGGPAVATVAPTSGAIPVTPGQASTPGVVVTPAGSGVGGGGSPKIQQFGTKHESIESKWQRPVAKTGGATHVRTFFGSLSQQGLEYLDRHINEWLDQHPDAEVKFATLQVGDMPTATGREPALIAQVWI